jgi:hypothetical protein
VEGAAGHLQAGGIQHLLQDVCGRQQGPAADDARQQGVAGGSGGGGGTECLLLALCFGGDLTFLLTPRPVKVRCTSCTLIAAVPLAAAGAAAAAETAG